ncbi:MAG TPA: branched-chain amino acid ABC transporter permease [Bradyrhizobium sp.]|nr:branched-chain amino acid ABC transporter permease [Bradyrhizobium sp.]
MVTFSAIVVDAASFAAWLFLVAVGLTLIFGVLRLLNIAHGAFYAIGAYASIYAISASVALGWGTALQLAAALGAAGVIGAVVGLLVERCVLRRLYGYPEPLVLIATYAVFLVLDDLTKMISGGRSLYAPQPRDSLGQIAIGGLQYPVYDIALIAVSLIVAAAVWYTLNRTRLGRCVTAVVFDSEISAAMGIHVGRIKTGTFIVGSVLGCLAGALTAPKIAVSPGIGVEVIVVAFAVVVVGGLGSIPGTLLGAVIIGLARATAAHLVPELEVFAVYFVMVAVLAVRPYGLLAPAAARRI